MKKVLLILSAAGLLFASCGTSKKLKSANTQIEQLNAQNAQLNNKIAENEKQIADLKQANEINSRDAADCRAAKEVLRRKKEKLDQALAARGTSVQEIEAKAEASVKKLRDAGCDVTYKEGRYYITYPDINNFKSGSYSVGARGREALNVVAQVLYDNPNVQAMVIGNTDTAQVKGVADNWTLSTERANAVVRVLSDFYNINPKRLMAAGRSKFNPIAGNDTEEGRAKNRRIEIVIYPDLNKILELIDE